MALNPVLDSDNEPLRAKTESFILKRKNIEFEVILGTLGKLKGIGELVLTTLRIVLLNKSPNTPFQAIDLPLAHMYNENFIQPVFGTNYIEGSV